MPVLHSNLKNIVINSIFKLSNNKIIYYKSKLREIQAPKPSEDELLAIWHNYMEEV